MRDLTDSQLIEACAVLLGMIEANTLPRPDAGICANLETVSGNPKGYNGYSGRRLRAFLEWTGRDISYPIEEAMFPHLEEVEQENLYIHNAINNLLWVGDAREARIALLNEFVAWLEERVADLVYRG